ncbi:MAG: hypothetical protein NTU67_06325 [Gemmatimonadetes bacterium]|nr:hypothetical protein [Gemmatimonadota bacterium]
MPASSSTTDRSEGNPNGHRPLEDLHHLLRRRGGGEIPVEMRVSKQSVANGTADAPGFVAGALEPRDDLANGRGRVKLTAQ